MNDDFSVLFGAVLMDGGMREDVYDLFKEFAKLNGLTDSIKEFWVVKQDDRYYNALKSAKQVGDE